MTKPDAITPNSTGNSFDSVTTPEKISFCSQTSLTAGNCRFPSPVLKKSPPLFPAVSENSATLRQALQPAFGTRNPQHESHLASLYSYNPGPLMTAHIAVITHFIRFINKLSNYIFM
jgi:hypothetical protein